MIWVKSQDGDVLTESASLHNDPCRFLLRSLAELPLQPLVYPINGRDFVLCGGPLILNGATIGKLYIALGITRDHKMFVTIVMSLSVASILAIIGMIVAITIYIQRSLIPLCQIG